MKLVMELEVREDGVKEKDLKSVREAMEVFEHDTIEYVRRLNKEGFWDFDMDPDGTEYGGSRKLDEPRFIINIVTMWDPKD